MSFFNKIFGDKETEDSSGDNSFWKPLHSEEQLNEAVSRSHQNRVVIFKHSTRCFISKTVLRNFEKEVRNSDRKADFYFLDLLAHRGLSNRIAEQFDIEHQSPQLIVLENGKAIKDASHQSISVDLV